jgi:hypothetical protein
MSMMEKPRTTTMTDEVDIVLAPYLVVVLSVLIGLSILEAGRKRAKKGEQKQKIRHFASIIS